MARIRTIKPEFWEDEKVGKLPIPCRLFFIGCWNFADDFGCIKGNAALLKSQIFPYDENLRVSEVKKWIDALVNARMLIPIIHAEESYYFIRTFRSHQVLDSRYSKSYIGKETVSDLINKSLSHDDVNTSSTRRHNDGNTPEEKEMEKEMEDSSSSDELLCETLQPHPERINYDELIKFFNSETKGVFGMIRAPLSDKRKGMISARIKSHGKEAFADMIRKAYRSDFLKGQNKQGWRASFDWLIKPTNFEKVISGNYDNKNIANTTTNGDNEDFMRNIAEGIARADFERRQRREEHQSV